MRKCLRCETAMVEDLAVMVTNGGYGVDVREKECSKVPWEKSNVPYVLNADTQKCTLIIPKASKSWQRKTSKPIPI